MSGKTEAPGTRAREDRPVELKSVTASGDRMEVVIPPGEYFLGDPCYVLANPLYDAIGDMIFPPGNNSGRDVMVEVTLADGAKAAVFDFRTKYGDGRYPYKVYWPEFREQGSVRGEGLAVDSGGLALVDRRLVERGDFDEERLAKLGTFVRFEGRKLAVTEGGNLCVPGLVEAWTDPPRDDDY